MNTKRVKWTDNFLSLYTDICLETGSSINHLNSVIIVVLICAYTGNDGRRGGGSGCEEKDEEHGTGRGSRKRGREERDEIRGVEAGRDACTTTTKRNVFFRNRFSDVMQRWIWRGYRRYRSQPFPAGPIIVLITYKYKW